LENDEINKEAGATDKTDIGRSLNLSRFLAKSGGVHRKSELPVHLLECSWFESHMTTRVEQQRTVIVWKTTTATALLFIKSCLSEASKLRSGISDSS
jgi:hypothetical protein